MNGLNLKTNSNKLWLPTGALSWYVALTLVLSIVFHAGCAPSGGVRQASEQSFDFSSATTYSITGGDAEQANFTGFERDKFAGFFQRAVELELGKKGLSPADPAAGRDARLLVRYSLREKLVITFSDAISRRLVWRGESRDVFTTSKLNQDEISTLVKQALSGF